MIISMLKITLKENPYLLLLTPLIQAFNLEH